MTLGVSDLSHFSCGSVKITPWAGEEETFLQEMREIWCCARQSTPVSHPRPQTTATAQTNISTLSLHKQQNSDCGTTSRVWVYPGCGTVDFQGTAIKHLWKTRSHLEKKDSSTWRWQTTVLTEHTRHNYCFNMGGHRGQTKLPSPPFYRNKSVKSAVHLASQRLNHFFWIFTTDFW